jgi:hypothetical protein
MFFSNLRFQGASLVDDTSEGPDIRFVIVGFVLPDLRTSVVWSTSLCVNQPFLCEFGDIEVSQFDSLISEHEHVGAFQISMVNLAIM